MFFGVSSFNFTRSGSKSFVVDTSNYNGLYNSYLLENVNNLKFSYFFFVARDCSNNSFFYKNWMNSTLDACVYDCSIYSDKPVNDSSNSQCKACDQTCLTCQGISNSQCLSCSASDFRVIAGATPTFCNCMSKYVPDPNGGAACTLCSSHMTGCDTCSSTSVCTSCITGFTGTTSCSCSSGSIVNGYCNTVLGCTIISIINGTQTCTTCDSSLLM